MSIDQRTRDDPRIQSALSDLREGITRHYPSATFEVETGGEPEGVYLTATVAIEDTGEVLDAIMDRLLEIQIDQYLPVYVIVVRPESLRISASTPARASG